MQYIDCIISVELHRMQSVETFLGAHFKIPIECEENL